jgi:hypothetical protein
MRFLGVVASLAGLASLSAIAHCSPSSTTAASEVEAGADAAPAVNECPTPTGPGTKHGGDNISVDTVWKAADSPHHVTFSFIIDETATLTIEPCAQVVFDAGYGIDARGSLVAEGTPTNPITFDAVDPAKPWSGILLGLDRSGHISLANATLSNGGSADDPNVMGLIDVRGPQTGAPLERLKVKNVTLKGSQQHGVVLRDSVAFSADSANLAISGAKLFPMRIEARLTSTIPTGTYTGNTTDELLLAVGASDVTNDTTIHDRGVPYRLGDGAGNRMVVGTSGPTAISATVTIEAGVKIRATAGASIVMNNASAAPRGAVGRLIVNGTAQKPVVFTSASATPAAGDWRGLVFNAEDPLNKIDYARVEYAGGPSQANSFHCDPKGGGNFSPSEDAAIALYGEPTAAFITNTTIVASAGDGIGRSWSGNPVDFLATNTFEQVATCKQSFPRATNGSCPATVPCP